MSDKIQVNVAEEIYAFDRKCKHYVLELDEIEREINNALNKVSATWKDQDFLEVKKLIDMLKMDLKLARTTVQQELLPYLANKTRIIAEKRG